jgi:putative drug exporter of the RND superfamily
MNRRGAELVSNRVTKWIVAGFWVVITFVAVLATGPLTDVEDNQAASWLPGDAQSTLALEAQEAFTSPNLIPAVVVYERDGGLTDEDQAAAAADAEEFASVEGIAGEVQGPVPSEDGEALETIVPIDLGPDGWELAAEVVDDMRATAADGPDGLTTHITGPAGNAADSADAFAGIDGVLLFAALGVVIFILLLTYRSPVLWLLPIISAVVALMCAQAVIYLLAEHAGLTVNAQSSGILTVLVIGASTDYALLLVARYREELRLHEDRHEAMAEALHRAGPAIIASAGTVVLGMACLVAATMNSTQGLGPVAAIGVGVGLLVMITLLPALLVIVSRWVFWPVRPQFGSAEPTERGFWARIGARMVPRPRLVWVVTTVLLGAAAFGMIGLNANGLTLAEGFRGTPDSIEGQDVVTEHFAGGAGSPVSVLANAGAADEVRTVVGETEGVAAADEPAIAGDTALVEATLESAPDSDDAYATIDRLRDAVADIPEADALVGGATAVQLDIQDASQRDNLVVIPLVLLVVFLILAVLLRAIVAPLLLIGTVVLSFGAALGLSALVFEYVFDMQAADSAFPLFVFVFLVALGIDYNIFLMTRVREEALDHGTRRGALIGLSATGGVITSAGLVLAGTFAVLATLPLTFLTQMGFAVALGVLLDTIIVRSVLVTALTLDVGPRMWWPSALSRRPEEPRASAGSEVLEREPALAGGSPTPRDHAPVRRPPDD